MIYKGVLDREQMTKTQVQAYRSWANQRYRCNNQNSPQYSSYGAKGIRVEYSAREFIGWWDANAKGKTFKRPTCGRIDHSKNYCFENIELQEASENGLESRLRNGQPKLHPRLAGRTIFVFRNSKLVEKCPSAYFAAKKFGVSPMLVSRHCRRHKGYSKTKTGLTFRWENEL